MYQPHAFQAVGVLVLFVCVAVVLLAQALKLKLPEKLNSLLIFTGAGFMFLSLAFLFYDDAKLRQELRNIPATQISKVVLSKGNLQKEITDTTEISKLMSQIQSVKFIKYIFRNHSTSIDEFHVRFFWHGNKYHYSFGHDSARQDEYWVFNKNIFQEREIGRIQSADFGKMVDDLLTQKTSDKSPSNIPLP